MNETIPEKSTSEAFSALWDKLTYTQQRFAIAMLQYKTKKDAAEAIGIEPNTAYKWNGDIDAVVDFMRSDMLSASIGILLSNASKAAMIKVAGLDSNNETIRQNVASELLDRVQGKPTQRNEVTGKDGEPLRVKFIDYGLNDSSTD